MNDNALSFDPMKIARDHAKRFAEIDEGVNRVVYFPEDSPEREIRLIVINTLGLWSFEPLRPLHFGIISEEGEPHTINVLDVTPEQWERVLCGEIALPVGWTLRGSQIIFTRQQPLLSQKEFPLE